MAAVYFDLRTEQAGCPRMMACTALQQDVPMTAPRKRLLAIIGPGILVAATGVGAGDLATGAFTGGVLGVAVLWAVVTATGCTAKRSSAMLCGGTDPCHASAWAVSS